MGGSIISAEVRGERRDVCEERKPQGTRRYTASTSESTDVSVRSHDATRRCAGASPVSATSKVANRTASRQAHHAGCENKHRTVVAACEGPPAHWDHLSVGQFLVSHSLVSHALVSHALVSHAFVSRCRTWFLQGRRLQTRGDTAGAQESAR